MISAIPRSTCTAARAETPLKTAAKAFRHEPIDDRIQTAETLRFCHFWDLDFQVQAAGKFIYLGIDGPSYFGTYFSSFTEIQDKIHIFIYSMQQVNFRISF